MANKSSKKSTQDSAQKAMQDQDKMTDILNTQKYITSNYNTYTNECATSTVRDKMMGILTDEHQIQAEVFNSMQQRGWYNPQKATQKDIDKAKKACQSN